MQEKISQKLAMQVAQLNYDKVVLEVQIEELKNEIADLKSKLENNKEVVEDVIES